MATHIPPSQCEQCVPTETLTNDTAITWIIETAHQTTCPNHPDNQRDAEPMHQMRRR
jgi:hypothetical protein